MKFRPISILCLTTMLGSFAAPAQQAATTPAAGSSSPVAFVYVIINSTDTTNSIVGYAANSAGKLTPIPGSPFNFNIVNLAVNGKYLFGAKNNENHINTFTIAANGSLKYIQTVSAGPSCEVPGPVVLDHTGSDLYVQISPESDCSGGIDYDFQSLSVQNSTGKLTYIGTTAAEEAYNAPLSILGNNKYAYGTDCVFGPQAPYDTFAGYRRQANGALTNASITAPLPSTGQSGTVYCRVAIASDPTNHLAVLMQQIDPSTSSYVGKPQLGIYTADQNGNLTTTSTAANMPETAVGNASFLAMSPSGKLLAVAEDKGVQVFHFNGANPITPYTGLLKTGESAIWGLKWDNANHLYVLSTDKLYVYTVTPTSVTQAPGSPHTNSNQPVDLIVQSLTR